MNKYAMNQEKINNPYDCIINWRVNQICNFSLWGALLSSPHVLDIFLLDVVSFP